jgi:hypothetical protein
MTFLPVALSSLVGIDDKGVGLTNLSPELAVAEYL